MAKKAPKPASRPDGVGVISRIKLFRRDMFSSQPERLYRAWMAQVRTPFFRSFLVNDPDLVRRVLSTEAENFPKSAVLADALRPLLGESIFATNAEQWRAQRDIIDPAFKGCPRQAFSCMREAGEAAIERMTDRANGRPVEMESFTSYLVADIIFRTLFSVPLPAVTAQSVSKSFREYQKTQPLWSLPALLKLPMWFPRFRSRASVKHAVTIRSLLVEMVDKRRAEIDAGTAPNDLATSLMATVNPKTDHRFSKVEMVDQVAIFFLAGHETSASALSWAFYLLAMDQGVQDEVAREAMLLITPPQSTDLSKLRFIKDVFNEVLRLYPPVPMFLRDAAKATELRGVNVPKGSMVIVSPWHLHRHERLWDNPDEFDPYRWQTENGKIRRRDAYIPFSTGPRVCLGAGFGRIEGVLMLAMFLKEFRFEATYKVPVPVAHLTVRAKDGIMLRVFPRDPDTT